MSLSLSGILEIPTTVSCTVSFVHERSKMLFSLLGLAVAQIFVHGIIADPVVSLKNGSYTGVYSTQYDQDVFLGIPYSQPPIGDLRFRPAQPLNTTWSGTRNATEYQPECYGYGVSEQESQCLHVLINV